jgi:hypothetical protein
MLPFLLRVNSHGSLVHGIGTPHGGLVRLTRETDSSQAREHFMGRSGSESVQYPSVLGKVQVSIVDHFEHGASRDLPEKELS